ncbi:hypothetical protein [Tsukamurella soli]|uniref:Excreted virulence factor EspC, type VII ESX diderm n=1 Tax=Tsukamurella soli TaxID=644556 RepID=A0ABP8K5C4_9ACTN
MGAGTEIDVTAVRREGRAFVDSAGELGSAATRIRRHRAKETDLGSFYRDSGARLTKTFEDIAVAIERWRDGSAVIGKALTGSAGAVAQADGGGAGTIAGAGAGAGAAGGAGADGGR